MIDLPDEQEDHEGDDNEIDKRVKENTVVYGRGAGCLRLRERSIAIAGEVEIEIGKIDFVEQKADRRHDDVAHEGSDYFSEGGTDNDTDRHVYHIAFDGELLEFFDHMFACHAELVSASPISSGILKQVQDDSIKLVFICIVYSIAPTNEKHPA